MIEQPSEVNSVHWRDRDILQLYYNRSSAGKQLRKLTDKLISAALALSVVGAFPFSPAQSAPPPNSETTPFNNEKYEDSANWMLTLNAREIKDYLKFNGSPLSPTICVTVKSQLRNELGGAWKEKRAYETLWYHNGQPFGLRRYEKLNFKEDSHGVIKIESSLEAQQQTKALINAALRLLPDIYHLKATPIVLMLPRELCNRVEGDLSSLRFYGARATTGDASALVLHVVSQEPGYDRYFYYAIRGGEILE